jgi:hypothetical protein
MKSCVLALTILAHSITVSQPIPEWTSPEGSDSVLIGWMLLRLAPTVGYTFYKLERTSLKLMSGPYSSTPTITIPLTVAEQPSDVLYPPFNPFDVSGDGAHDIIISRRYNSSEPYRYGFRIVNSVTGQNVYLFDSPVYSYAYVDISDLDRDGFLELVVLRQSFPPDADHAFEFLVFQTGVPQTSASGDGASLPDSPVLHQNFPNPFNPSTTIDYSISQSSNITLSILNTLGQHVATLVNEQKPAGTYRQFWNAEGMAGGVYYYQLKAGEFTQTKKLLILR